jgi:putative transposase
MSVVKLELRLSEIPKAVEAFQANRKLALEQLGMEIKSVVGNVINQLLNTEIDIFLGQPEQSDNKRNGYHPAREYTLKGIGCIRVRIPKDRKSRFESSIVPSYERIDPRLKADMAVLHLAGLSTRMLAMISKRLLAIDVSKGSVSNSLDLVRGEAARWLQRPITKHYWALYVDGTNFRIQRQGSSEREPLLVVLGIDDNNHRSILAIEPGTRDDVNAWRHVFRGLVQRGLESRYVRLGIMDGLPGLENLFKEEFVNSVTARCWRHAMENVLNKAPKRFQEGLKMLASKVMYADSEGSAREAFARLKELMGSACQRSVACLEKGFYRETYG